MRTRTGLRTDQKDLGSHHCGVNKEKRGHDVPEGYDLEGYRALLSPETRAALEAAESKAVEDACVERFESEPTHE